MKTTSTILLFLLAVRLPAALGEVAEPATSRPRGSQSRFAALDDVRSLANGLLHLGQSLREFVDNTRSQINNIFQKLNIFDRSFYQLSLLASEIKEEEEELKKTTVALQANNEEIKGLSAQINSRVDSILLEKSSLQDKLQGMEEKLSSLSQGLTTSKHAVEIVGLREMIHSQERSITELLRAVTEQSDQLNLQQEKINILEEKLSTNTQAQDTIERIPENLGREAPTLTPYLSTDELTNVWSDCTELFDRGVRVSGVYAIRPTGSQAFVVFCDMSRDYGETVIQRRKDGSVNFDQTWEKYENGFGDFQGEFWLGLRKIHSLVAQGNSVLHIQLEDLKQGRRSIEYRLNLSGPERNYTIQVTHLSGDLPDPMSNHRGVMFSTKDWDNRGHGRSACGQGLSGGWWLDTCGDANLNGRYFHARAKGRQERRRGVHWRAGPKSLHALQLTQISVRPPRTSSSSSSSSEAGVF